ncbi:hypothetical protein PFISCL1PPCAC_14054, partial [Pristionchus fissidentatus]
MHIASGWRETVVDWLIDRLFDVVLGHSQIVVGQYSLVSELLDNGEPMDARPDVVLRAPLLELGDLVVLLNAREVDDDGDEEGCDREENAHNDGRHVVDDVELLLRHRGRWG